MPEKEIERRWLREIGTNKVCQYSEQMKNNVAFEEVSEKTAKDCQKALDQGNKDHALAMQSGPYAAANRRDHDAEVTRIEVVETTVKAEERVVVEPVKKAAKKKAAKKGKKK